MFLRLGIALGLVLGLIVIRFTIGLTFIIILLVAISNIFPYASIGLKLFKELG
jgi:hypothetical protein